MTNGPISWDRASFHRTPVRRRIRRLQLDVVTGRRARHGLGVTVARTARLSRRTLVLVHVERPHADSTRSGANDASSRHRADGPRTGRLSSAAFDTLRECHRQAGGRSLSRATPNHPTSPSIGTPRATCGSDGPATSTCRLDDLVPYRHLFRGWTSTARSPIPPTSGAAAMICVCPGGRWDGRLYTLGNRYRRTFPPYSPAAGTDGRQRRVVTRSRPQRGRVLERLGGAMKRAPGAEHRRQRRHRDRHGIRSGLRWGRSGATCRPSDRRGVVHAASPAPVSCVSAAAGRRARGHVTDALGTTICSATRTRKISLCSTRQVAGGRILVEGMLLGLRIGDADGDGVVDGRDNWSIRRREPDGHRSRRYRDVGDLQPEMSIRPPCHRGA